jgi:hypothetical protein
MPVESATIRPRRRSVCISEFEFGGTALEKWARERLARIAHCAALRLREVRIFLWASHSRQLACNWSFDIVAGKQTMAIAVSA